MAKHKRKEEIMIAQCASCGILSPYRKKHITIIIVDNFFKSTFCAFVSHPFACRLFSVSRRRAQRAMDAICWLSNRSSDTFQLKSWRFALTHKLNNGTITVRMQRMLLRYDLHFAYVKSFDVSLLYAANAWCFALIHLLWMKYSFEWTDAKMEIVLTEHLDVAGRTQLEQ